MATIKTIYTVFVSLLVWIAAITAHAQNEEPLTIPFDLYVAGRFKGDIPVSYTDNWSMLANAKAGIEKLPKVKDTTRLKQLLEGKIEGHTRSLTDIGSIHIDPHTFRVDISLSPKMLFAQRLAQPGRLAPPSDHFSLRQGMNLNATSQFNGSAGDTTLRHHTQASQGHTRAEWQGNITRGEGYTLDTLTASHDISDGTVSAGLLQTKGQTFALSHDIYGLAYETISEIHANNSLLQGSRVEVFVPSRARVEVFKDGSRLLFTRILDFGLQELDTSSFPTGSYNITIKITEADGTTHEESQLFNKSSRLVPRNKPIYTVQAGYARDDVDLIDVPIYLLGMRNRISDNLELGASIYGSEGFASLESTLNGLWRNYQFNTSFSLTNKKDTAINGFIRAEWQPWNWHAGFTRTLTGHEQSNSEVNLLASNRNSYNAGISRQFDNISASLSGNRNKSGDSSSYSYGPRLRWNAYREGNHAVTLAGHFLKTDGGLNTGVNLSYNWRGDDWSSQTNIERNRQNKEDIATVRNTLRYSNRPYNAKGFEADITTSARQQEGKSGDMDAEALYVGSQATLRGFARTTMGANGHTRSAGIEAESSFILFGDGKVDIAPNIETGSILLAEMIGNTDEQEMTVVVNGSPKGNIVAGEVLPINLPPYREYEVTLRAPDDGEIVQFNRKPHTFTLFPGNTVHNSWQVHKAVLVVTKIIDATGQPVRWAPVEGLSETAFTDRDGNVELELTGFEAPYIKHKNYDCMLALPKTNSDKFFQIFDTVLCL